MAVSREATWFIDGPNNLWLAFFSQINPKRQQKNYNLLTSFHIHSLNTYAFNVTSPLIKAPEKDLRLLSRVGWVGVRGIWNIVQTSMLCIFLEKSWLCLWISKQLLNAGAYIWSWKCLNSHINDLFSIYLIYLFFWLKRGIVKLE